MSVNLIINGSVFPYPTDTDSDWGVVSSQWAQAVTTGMLQKAGGAFSLLSEVDFGASHGVKSLYLKSRNASPASTGFLRLGNNESVSFRNAANDNDISLTVNASDTLEFNGNPVLAIALGSANSVLKMNADETAYEFGQISNSNIDPAAAITYSKLTLTNSIVNADVNAAAAIAYSKLTLTGSIVNADISGSASIAVNKLAPVTGNRALVADASGFVAASSVTDTELGRLSGVSSNIQTQLNAKLDDFTGTTDNRVVRTDGASGNAVQESPVSIDDSGNVSGVVNLDLATITSTEIVTPSTPSASKRKIYPKADGWYDLNASGIEKKLGGGSGAGEINVFGEGSSEPTGWAVTAGSVGVTRYGPNLPLGGIIPTAIAITLFSSGNTAYFRWTMPAGLKNTKLKLAWSQKPDTGYVSGDMKVEIHTNTLSDYSGTDVKLNLASDSAGVTSIASATGGFQTSYDSDGSDYYELRIIRTGTGSAGLFLANVVSGPGLTAQGAIVSEWESYTPVGSDQWTTNTTYLGQWRRVGSNLEIKGKVLFSGVPSGGASGTTPFFAIPSGLTIDYSGIIDPTNQIAVGKGIITDAGTKGYLVVPVTNAGNPNHIRLIQTSNTSSISIAAMNTTSPFTIGSGDFITFDAIVPIAEWAGSGTVNLLNSDIQSPDKAGFIQAYAGATAPNGWRVADGTAVSRTTYSALFTNIGTAFGVGDGSTTFNLPDLRGMFLRGTGTHGTLAKAAGGNFEGPAVGASQNDKMQGHRHNLNTSALINSGIRLATGTATVYATVGLTVLDPTSDGVNGTPRKGNETAPVNVGVTYIIKLFDDTAGVAVGFGELSANASGLMPANHSNLDDASATRLGLKSYSHGTTYNGGNAPTISGPAGLAVVSSSFVPKQMQDGSWVMDFDFSITHSSLSSIDSTLQMGTTFLVDTAINGYAGSSNATYKNANGGLNTIRMRVASATTASYWSGRVRLTSKPNWAY